MVFLLYNTLSFSPSCEKIGVFFVSIGKNVKNAKDSDQKHFCLWYNRLNQIKIKVPYTH